MRDKDMKKHYYIDLGSPMIAKLHTTTEPLETLPKHWKELSEEEVKAYTQAVADTDLANAD